MSVSPTKKIFKCFSCGVGGNVFEFLMKYKHLSFPEAVVELAQEFNVNLDGISFAPKQDKYSAEEKRLFEVNTEASKYYQVNLSAAIGAKAKEYLLKRNITNEQIQYWEIGYAQGNEIVKHLQKVGFTMDEIVHAGLATKKDNGTYDYFNERIVFPIKNLDGFIVGFSGRVLTDEKPKYLNTRETKIFKKSNILFNINEVWKNKEMLDSLIILEGFMDVISLKKIGVNNAVALMGTNFSNFQLKIIKDLKKPLKLFLDGDAAGTKAMYKISALLIQNKIKFTIIDNVSKFDPDELINQGKSALVLKLIAESANPYQYFLDKFLANEKDVDFDQLSEISARMIALLKYETNYILVDKVIQLMHERLGISLEAIKKELDVQPRVATFEEQSTMSPSQSHPSRQLVKKTANWTSFDTMRNKIFISLLKSGQYLDEIEPWISQISDNKFNYERILSKLVEFYRTNRYQGDDLKTFKILLDEDNVPLKDQKEIDYFIQNTMYGYNATAKLDAHELSDMILTIRIKRINDEIHNIQQNTRNLEAQLTQTDKLSDEKILNKLISNNLVKWHSLIEQRSELTELKETNND